MKKHLYLLIATLAITLLSADAMAQKKKTRRYFHPEYDFGYLYKVKGEIDSMRITISNPKDPKVGYSVLLEEDKKFRIMKLTMANPEDKDEIVETIYTSSNGRDYDKQRQVGMKSGIKRTIYTKRTVDIDDTHSMIIKTEGNKSDTIYVEYHKNYSKERIPVYYTGMYAKNGKEKIGTIYLVNVFNKDGYLISYSEFFDPEKEDTQVSDYNFLNQYFNFDNRNGLVNIVQFRPDAPDDILTSKNTFDKKGNWILQIGTSPKEEAHFERKIYYKNKATK